ncbi:hypothetical protein IQ13_1833 [Lacibacter cauensis]|uniref:Uncharacterized protein n=1 Tax=Lacibacter cauensis TaxID=510947 RepID=A0A562SR29_9BACT|nr:hypothetical protein [Lacibacter cauensis]TWI83719.1 hypothetical protein IQ13_1833 [Lacibacter cauensis]
MNYSALTDILRKNIGAYKLLLIDMLTANEALASAISKTYYESNIGIVEWVESVEANSFFDFNSKLLGYMKPRLGFNDIIYDEREVKAINKLMGNEQKNYFGRREFDSLEGIKGLSPRPFYIYDEKKMMNLDYDFVQLIGGYNEIGNNAGQKRISDKVALELVYVSKKLGYNSIDAYCFPEIYIVVNKNKYWICEEADVKSFLFLGNRSFSLFQKNSVEPILDGSGNIISFKYKTDEPKIIIDSLENKFILTNSDEAKEKYNLFINMTLSLSIVFFNLFEKWFINEMADLVEANKEL